MSGFASHIACTTWDTHSHPAPRGECVLMRSCGTLNVRTDLLSHCSCHQPPDHVAHNNPSDTTRRLPQGSHTPHPHCLDHLVRHFGRDQMFSQPATTNATWGGLARRGLKCSLVIPEGPAAAPLRAVLRLRPKRASSNLNSEVWWTISSGSGSQNCAGRRLKAWRVCSFPDANSAPSRACRAEESSPN